MNETSTEIVESGVLNGILWPFYDMPAGWAALTVLAFAGVGVWLVWRALPLWRIVQAIKTASTVTVGSAAEGLVRVNGVAFPGQDVPEGFVAPKHVWRVTEKFDTSSNIRCGTSRSTSLAPILVRDATGECTIDPREAIVLYAGSTSSVDHHIFDGATFDSEKIISTGDTVFAIGLPGHAKQRSGHRGLPRCSLRRSSKGVLLLSGRSEARTRRWFQWRLWPTACLAALCLAVAGLGFEMHLTAYPEPSLSAYLDALRVWP